VFNVNNPTSSNLLVYVNTFIATIILICSAVCFTRFRLNYRKIKKATSEKNSAYFDEKFFFKTCFKEDNPVLIANIGVEKVQFAIIKTAKKCPKRLKPAVILERKSSITKSIVNAVNEAIVYAKKKYGLTPKKACFSVAGMVSKKRNLCENKNLPWTIDVRKILNKTKLETATLINDFEAQAYGIQAVSEEKLVCINKGKKRKSSSNKVVVGAGSGLGKSLIIQDPISLNRTVVATEAGHAAFPPENETELCLVKFIKKLLKVNHQITWEDLVSSKGIERIYKFLAKTNNTKSKKPQPEKLTNYTSSWIIKNYNSNNLCKKTVDMFLSFYGRCIKNFVLGALTKGGVYISGGIVRDNISLLKNKIFFNEFTNDKNYKSLLKDVPIHVVKDKYTKLYGAAIWSSKALLV